MVSEYTNQSASTNILGKNTMEYFMIIKATRILLLLDNRNLSVKLEGSWGMYKALKI